MPSTARITIAGKDASSYVQQNIDDVVNTSFSRQAMVDLAANAPLTITWPVSGETFVYLRLPKQAAAYTLNFVTATGSPGWTVSVPAGTSGFVPVILPKPQTPTYILTANAVVSFSAYYF
jgi:hypothetical protein